ncbi:hypothetical protein DENSPDRAFT_845461 [Dentipellis sp. KUC8613]|nr:hypothetical protein DENSPDRAFT_845461 [Dentipellis sp. KUC8613]
MQETRQESPIRCFIEIFCNLVHVRTNSRPLISHRWGEYSTQVRTSVLFSCAPALAAIMSPSSAAVLHGRSQALLIVTIPLSIREE